MNTLLLCLEVFFARILDVSIGSVRTLFLVKEKNILASILAFIEIIIWFLVAQQTLTSDTNIFVIISYAGGYALGTYIGGLVNKKFVKGTLTAMIVISEDNKKLIDILKEAKFGISIIDLEENKLLLLVEFKKQNENKLKDLVYKVDDNAFIIINETRAVENGFFS